MNKTWFKQLLNLGLIGLTACALVGCSHYQRNKLAKYQKFSAAELVQHAEMRLAKRDYNEAIEWLDALQAIYPFSKESRQGELDLIFANFQNEDYELCQAAADRFIHLYPADRDADYAYYMKGLSFLEKNHMLRRTFLYASQQERLDDQGLISAFLTFSDLIKRFPNSAYADDAKARMYTIKHILAEHEIYLARYYYERGGLVAAINRAIPVLRYFASSAQAKEALEIIINSYRGLKLEDQAARVTRLWEANYGSLNGGN